MNTLKEVAERLRMPESTLRLYRDEFEEWIPTQGEGRRRRYDERGVEALRRIIEGKRAGWTAGKIRDELARDRTPVARARRRNTDERLDEIAARLQAQASEMALLRVEVGALREELRRLTEVLRRDAVLAMEDAVLISSGLSESSSGE
jgi:DNA-binding transcriptional MerR regulator